MKKFLHRLSLVILLFSGLTLIAQNVGINATGLAPATSAGLDISFTNKGVLLPRVALTATNLAGPITTPATSLLVYNTATAGISPNNVTPGYYSWNGTKWIAFGGSGGRDWSLLGNAGTAVATNFLGTTDNISLAFKTNNIERMRLRNDGIMTVNSAGAAFATSTFYSLATLNDNAIDGNVSGTGSGVYGQSTGTGEGVSGLNTTATGQGVQATNLHVSGTGLIASGNNTTANFLGVGSGGAFTGTGIGISAWSTTLASGNGIIAGGNNVSPISMTNGAGGTFTSNNIGAAGITPSANGNGIYGENTTVSGIGSGSGVIGFTNQSNGSGVWGQNSNSGGSAMTAFNTAAIGSGLGVGLLARTSQLSGTGVTGSNLHTSGTGIAGAGNNIGAIAPGIGAGGSFIGYTQGIFAKNTSGLAGSQVIHIENNFGNAWNIGHWSGVSLYKIIGSGAVSTIVKDLNEKNVTMFCPESPEVLFQDYGEGKLVNGIIHIELDPIFAKNIVISEKHPLRVYIQLEGDCKGVYVTNKTASGFDVVELNGGQSNTPFQYTVICNRADEKMLKGRVSHYADLRFPLSTIGIQKTKQLYTGNNSEKKTNLTKEISQKSKAATIMSVKK